MRILLSAFACSPGHGSDQAVGWLWAEGLAHAGHDVTVVTREAHRAAIERYEWGESTHKPKFVYVDLPVVASFLGKLASRNHLYYPIWQHAVYKRCLGLHKQLAFDVVHHVTWVNVRQTGFLWRLGAPYVVGPVAGGDSAPMALRSGMSAGEWLKEIVRDVCNWLLRFDPLTTLPLKRARHVWVTSRQTQALLPRVVQERSGIKLAICLEPGFKAKRAASWTGEGSFRILFVGRFIGLKGMHLGMAAFARFARTRNARLTLVGRGPEQARWQASAAKEGITQFVDWIEWMPQEKLPDVYASHHAFLFPSLHDSGGLVVLEAMACGLPAIALALGGPAEIVDASSGYTVDAMSGSEAAIAGLNDALVDVSRDPRHWSALSSGAVLRAQQFSPSALMQDIYPI